MLSPLPHHRARAALPTLLVLALALAGCSGSDEPAAESTPGATTSSATDGTEPTDPGLDFVAEEPSEVDGFATKFDKAGETLFPETGVASVALVDDVVLTAGGTQVLARTVPDLADAYTVDAELGDYVDLWIDEDAGLGYTLSQATEEGTGTTLGTEQYGVQRFDLETGEIDGSATMEIPQDNAGGGAPRIGWILGDDRDVVVIGMRGEGEETSRTVAGLDLDAGEVAWKQSGANPMLLEDGRVVVNTGTNAKPGAVLGLDARTGERQWRTLLLTKTASVVGVDEDAVLIATTDGFYNLSAITRVRLRTGRLDASVEAATIESSDVECHDAGERVAVCSFADGTVSGWNLRRNEAAWSLPTRARLAPIVTNVEEGLVYGVLNNNVSVVLDARTGEDLVTVAGVSPLDVNEYGGVYTFVGSALFAPVLPSE